MDDSIFYQLWHEETIRRIARMTEPNLETNHINMSNPLNSNQEFPTLKWPQFILFFVLFLGLGFFFGIIIGVMDAVMNNGLVKALTTGYNALFFDAFLFIIALLVFKSVRNFIKQGINFQVLKDKKTYFYILGGIAIFYISQFTLVGLLHLDNPAGQPQTLGADMVGNSGIQMFLFTLSIAIITPIKEELLYRGILYKFLEVKYNFWVGLVVAS